MLGVGCLRLTPFFMDLRNLFCLFYAPLTHNRYDGMGIINDRPCGVPRAEEWPAKITVVQEVLEWLLGLADDMEH